MKLSEDQVKLFWRLWAAACRYQGWTRQRGLTSAQIDVKRKELLARLGFGSLHDVDRRAGFGRVKSELLALADNLRGAVEADHPEMDGARRKRYLITFELIPCLALYVEDPVGYVEQILRDKFRISPASPVDLEALSIDPDIRTRMGVLHERPSELDQAMMTLTARLQALRKAAGHTIHAMRIGARLPCHCRLCRSQAAPRADAPAPSGARNNLTLETTTGTPGRTGGAALLEA